jgi:hypothetical protein
MDNSKGSERNPCGKMPPSWNGNTAKERKNWTTKNKTKI